MSHLFIVGTGIGGSGQLSIEARAHITDADVVFYVVADPLMAHHVRSLNPKAASLADCYGEGKERLRSYQEMADRIANALDVYSKVCAVFYGHPGIFTTPSHAAIALARLKGHQAKMLPGISAEDCLFADLGFDPAQSGCQSFEATDFLVRQKKFDICSALILWQIGAIGEASVVDRVKQFRLRILADCLIESYGDEHEVYVYEAAQNVLKIPLIFRTPLLRLDEAPVSPISTLYIPPAKAGPVSRVMFERLGMEESFGFTAPGTGVASFPGQPCPLEGSVSEFKSSRPVAMQARAR